MFINIILLILGFIILIKAADYFVDGASSLAQHFKVSKLVIGLTIVAFGTSAPEFAVSVQSLVNDSPDLVIGNVVGSNIINILLILGVASLIAPIKVKDNTVKKEIPICMLLTILLAVLFLDGPINGDELNMISRADGITIVLFFIIFIYYLFTIMKNKKEDIEKPDISLFTSILLSVGGIVFIVLSSDLVVNQAVEIAHHLNISERIISLTIIALGTSLPELITSISAARKGEQDILVGNIIGSNIFNICVVLGLPAAVFGAIVPGTFNYLDFIMFVVSAIVLFLVARNKYIITKFEGVFMLILFACYYIYILL